MICLTNDTRVTCLSFGVDAGFRAWPIQVMQVYSQLRMSGFIFGLSQIGLKEDIHMLRKNSNIQYIRGFTYIHTYVGVEIRLYRSFSNELFLSLRVIVTQSLTPILDESTTCRIIVTYNQGRRFSRKPLTCNTPRWHHTWIG